MTKRKDIIESDDDHAVKAFKGTSILSNNAKDEVSDVWRDKLYETAKSWGYDSEEEYNGPSSTHRC